MELEYNFIQDTKVIPEFITCRKFTHKKCFDISQNLFYFLRKLYSGKVLPSNEIKNIFIEILGCINDMLDIDSVVALEYHRYILDIVSFYKEVAIENELYETAENLNRFFELMADIKK
jgi:hypothetical protein